MDVRRCLFVRYVARVYKWVDVACIMAALLRFQPFHEDDEQSSEQ